MSRPGRILTTGKTLTSLKISAAIACVINSMFRPGKLFILVRLMALVMMMSPLFGRPPSSAYSVTKSNNGNDAVYTVQREDPDWWQRKSLYAARLGMHVEKNRIVGIYIYRLPRGHVLRALGFRKGDLLKGYNGRSMEKSIVAALFMRALQTEKKLTIDFERRGKRLRTLVVFPNRKSPKKTGA